MSRLVSVWNLIQSCWAFAPSISGLLLGERSSSSIFFRSKTIFRQFYFFVIGNVPSTVVGQPEKSLGVFGLELLDTVTNLQPYHGAFGGHR